MQANPYANMVVSDTVDSTGYSLPAVGADVTVGTSANGLNASVQITGVIVILIMVALVVMAKKWPILK